MKFIKSLFTDGQWDGDLVKVFGAVLIVVGVVGFFMEKQNFQWIIGFGASMAVTGKFSIQGQHVRYFLFGLAAGIACAITCYLVIIAPNNDRRLARIEAEFNSALDASREELDGARESLARAENANRELAKRIDDLGQSNNASSGIAGQIASGIDGDLDAVDSIRNAIRDAIGIVREVQGGK